jgi:hypothetical protein
MPELDDATAAYVLETGKAFEDLRQVAAELAGLLVLEAAGARSELPQHPMLGAAEELFRGAAETTTWCRPPRIFIALCVLRGEAWQSIQF